MGSDLNKRFEKFGSAPTDELWSRIESSMDEKKKRKPLFGSFYYSIAAIFSIGIATLYFNYPANDLTRNSTMTKENVSVETKTTLKQIVKTTKKEDYKNPSVAENNSTNKNIADKNAGLTIHTNTFLKKQTPKSIAKNHMAFETKDRTNVNDNYSVQDQLNIVSLAIANETVTVINPDDTLNRKESDSIKSDNLESAKSNLSSIEIAKDTARTAKERRFEIGLSYSWFSGFQKLISTNNDSYADYNNVVPGNLNSNESFEPSDSTFYSIQIPFNTHLNFNYYINSKWRLDSEFGYSQFRYNYFNQENNKKEGSPIIHSISIPLSLSYIAYIHGTNHSLSISGGFINDFSTPNWNKSNLSYYGLSSQIKMGYAYNFSPLQAWRAYFNIGVRNSIFESKVNKSSFSNRNLYGLQIGVVRIF